MDILFFCVVAALAFANGANDNFKGVATLWGGGDLSYRQAWFLANFATLLGAVLAIYLGAEVAKTFSGKGVVGTDVLNSYSFAFSFASGAGLTVFLATVLRYPVSTTHSILGALAGAGLALSSGKVNLQPLIESGMLPLLMSPFIAALATYILWKLRNSLLKPVFTSELAGSLSKPMHILSGTAVCFSRAVNDTPKIASIALLGSAVGMSHISVYASIGLVMTLGGVLFAKRIAEVMCHEITQMNSAEGLTGNLVTAFLVIFASKFGLAVSTTHVSVGALFGIGMENKTAHKKKILEILFSWVMTLPIAFALAFAIAKIMIMLNL